MRRRWVGVVGLVVALAGAVLWRVDRPHYEAEVTIQGSSLGGPVVMPESGSIHHFPAPNGQIAVRGSGRTAELASAAASTYARSYVRQRDEDAARGIGDAADELRQVIARLQAQIDQAGAGAPPAVLEQHRILSDRLDLVLHEPASGGLRIVGSTPATRAHDALPPGWVLLALGGALVLGSRLRPRG